MNISRIRNFFGACALLLSSGAAYALPPEVSITAMASPIATGGDAARGGTSEVRFRIYNPSASTASSLAFTTTYNANMANSGGVIGNTCGGTATGVDGGTSIALSGGTLTPWQSCEVSIKVKASVAASYLVTLPVGSVSA